jgi:glutamine amidotransferase
MIAIVDYGVGNLKSIENAVKFHNNELAVAIVSEPDDLRKFSKIILPGVGAFGDAIRKVREKKFDLALVKEAKKGKPILGICLGMQLLATVSHEYGSHNGLNLIPGEVISFRTLQGDLRVPHMGWNDVHFLRKNTFVQGITNGSDFYFVHSYFFRAENPTHVLGITEYGLRFASMINRDNIFGVQFHPEKSQVTGLALVKNFVEM